MTAVVSPRSLDEALDLLAGTPSSLVLAGGTDLMVELSTLRTQAEHVLDIWRVDELRGIHQEGSDLHLGALTTCTDLLEDPLVATHADILAAAARDFGAVQIRNRATIAGNLGTASPAADLNPVLLALSARVRLVSRRGRRELPVADFLTGYRETRRRPDELIEGVLLPERPPGERRAFRKIGTRRAQSISKVVVVVALEKGDGELRRLDAAAGSVGPRTVRLAELERGLRGRPATRESITRAVRASLDRDISPIDDVRSTAVYRRQALGRVLVTMLARLWEDTK